MPVAAVWEAASVLWEAAARALAGEGRVGLAPEGPVAVAAGTATL